METHREKIVEHVPKQLRDYFRELCTTQQFSMYLQDLIKAFHERKQTEENFVDQFDIKISNLEIEKCIFFIFYYLFFYIFILFKSII